MDTYPLLLDTVVASKPALKLLWEFISSHIEWIASGIIAAGTYLVFKIRKLIKWVNEINMLKVEIPRMKEILMDIKSELTSNGGHSLKDQVSRIDRRVALVQNISWSEKELSEDGFFVTNEHGEWTRCNRAFLNMVGAQESDCLNDGWIGYISFTGKEQALDEYNSAINQKRSAEFPCSFKRDVLGSSWKVNVYLQPMKNDGKIIGFTGTVHKI